jgi:tetratricopeptide (TPR) repeat protein
VIPVDGALYAAADGDYQAAWQLCSAAVAFSDAAECSPRLTNEQFNLTLGQAFWMLGQREQAAECFRRSRRPAEDRFERTLVHEFGIAAP